MKKHLTLIVTGMHCVSCEKLITDDLASLNGVSEIKVDHKKGRADLEYDPQVVAVTEIISVIKGLGYEARE